MDNNTPQKMITTNGIRISLIAVFTFLSLFLIAETITLVENFGQQNTPPTNTIVVKGSGQATLVPNIARVSFTISNTSPIVDTAQSATTKQTNTALAFVKKSGIADKDIKTISYNIYPKYSYESPCPNGRTCSLYRSAPKIVGYKVSNTIQVTIRDISSIGAFIGGLGKVSVQNVSGPSFALSNSTIGHDTARASAIKNAKTQAVLLAKQLGVHLGKLVKFNESSENFPRPMYSVSTLSATTKTSPKIPVGENTYNASVSLIYEIY